MNINRFGNSPPLGELEGAKKILFVCIENSNRSQMSQAFAKMFGGKNVEAYSAGSKPSGIVNPKAIAAMKELGYDLRKHDSKSLEEVKQYAPFDAVVTMGCGDACPSDCEKTLLHLKILLYNLLTQTVRLTLTTCRNRKRYEHKKKGAAFCPKISLMKPSFIAQITLL